MSNEWMSCLTLCDPIDGGPPGSPVPGILQARTLEWVAISFSNAWKGKVKVKSLSRVQLFVTPWSAAYQAPPSMGFSRQEYWSGVPLPSPMNGCMYWIGQKFVQVLSYDVHFWPTQCITLYILIFIHRHIHVYTYTGKPCFIVLYYTLQILWFFSNWRYMATLHWASLLAPFFSCICIFLAVFAYFISLSCVNNSYNISNFCYCRMLWWSVISDLWCYYYDSIKAQRFVNIF